jgi:hypothetical protein
LLHCNHSAGLLEGVFRIAFWLIKSDTFILIESLGEVISINNTENSAIDIEVWSNIQISPWVYFGLLSGNQDFMSLEEDTLRDTAILYSVFKDMESIVIQIVVNGALANTVIFCRVLNNGLLEVGLEM